MEFFEMMPPTLEEWTSQGPRAHPLPSTCIWSPNYEPSDYYSDEDDDEEDD